MSLKSDPDMGINSWLEDELYQQYLHDRTAVDEEWKHLFEGNGATEAAPPRRLRSPPISPRSRPVSGDLQPLRGAAGRIAENMSASLAIPARDLAADHRRQGDGREPAHHQPAPDAGRTLESFLYAPHRLGDREGPRNDSRAELRVRGEGRAAASRRSGRR